MLLCINETDFKFADCHTCILKKSGTTPLLSPPSLEYLRSQVFSYTNFALFLCQNMKGREGVGREEVVHRSVFFLCILPKNRGRFSLRLNTDKKEY